MNNGNMPYGLGYMIVTLCRILKPQEEWEGKSTGPVSSMKVAVPHEVMEETAASGELDLLDLWVEKSFRETSMIEFEGVCLSTRSP